MALKCVYVVRSARCVFPPNFWFRQHHSPALVFLVLDYLLCSLCGWWEASGQLQDAGSSERLTIGSKAKLAWWHTPVILTGSRNIPHQWPMGGPLGNRVGRCLERS